jgi:ATP-dependent RNA helicase CshB
MINKFSDYNFNEYTNKFIELNNFTNPTKIQKACLQEIRKGKDIVAISKTGTGKTHAFLIPLMDKIDVDSETVQAVITAPTRELATQIHNFAKLMTEANPKIKIKLITGGMDRDKMVDSIKSQPHLVIGTPGRIKDIFMKEDVLRLDTAKYFVVDEADMTLEYGFLDDVDAICSRMRNDLQMLCFSATIPNGLKPFLKKYMNSPQTIKIEEDKEMNPRIDHVLINCKQKSYVNTLINIMPGFMPYVCLIFTNTRQEASDCTKQLRGNGFKVLEFHGGLQARERKQAMKQLTSMEYTYIVATDIASRGIDVEGVTHVVSLGFPAEIEFYIHRAGRCGRAGKEGTCFALYKENDTLAIRELLKRNIEFHHRAYRNGDWVDLHEFEQKRLPKNDLREKEIAKTLYRKNQKVKPNYKKKRSTKIMIMKKKERQIMIRKDIKTQKKERYKAAALAKANEEKQ